jgi:hypothetical protein
MILIYEFASQISIRQQCTHRLFGKWLVTCRNEASGARALRNAWPSLAVRSRIYASALLKLRSLNNVCTWLTLRILSPPDFFGEVDEPRAPPFTDCFDAGGLGDLSDAVDGFAIASQRQLRSWSSGVAPRLSNSLFFFLFSLLRWPLLPNCCYLCKGNSMWGVLDKVGDPNQKLCVLLLGSCSLGLPKVGTPHPPLWNKAPITATPPPMM